MAVFEYMNDETVAGYMDEICNEIRAQFVLIEQAYARLAGGGQTIQIAARWDEWIRTHHTLMGARARTWVTNNIAAMRQVYANLNDAGSKQVKEILNDLEARVPLMEVSLDGLT